MTLTSGVGSPLVPLAASASHTTSAGLLAASACSGGDGADAPAPPPSQPSSPSAPSGSGAAGGVDPFAAYVWQGENNVSSFGNVKVVSLTDLPQGARELDGTWARIKGQTRLNGNFLQLPYQDRITRLTTDGFDQVQCYYAITVTMQHLNRLGFDMAKVIAQVKRVVANVNAVQDINAWFDPRTGELTFGVALKSKYGRWSLASDHEIVRHELGHLILHCLNQALTSWYAGDGGAIHEGFGDALVALYGIDSEISEDFPPNVGRDYGTDRGLRNVNNSLRYQDVGDEVHDRGQVYGGWWWSVHKALEPILKDGRRSADLTGGFLVNHATHYATNRPGPADFLDAALAGAKAYLDGSKKYDVDFKQVDAVMRAESQRRGMLDPSLPKKGERKPIDLDLALMLTRWRDPIAFAPESSALGVFGGRDYFQQFAVLEGRHFVRMLGSGLIVFSNLAGEPESYSSSDVRLQAKIDPALNFGRPEALAKVKEEAERQLRESERKKEEVDRRAVSSAADERRKDAMLDLAEIRRRADERAYEAAKAHDNHRTAQLVLMPEGYNGSSGGKEDLHWELKFGLSDFYVNARTGEVDVEKMPAW